ncbi:VanZ family protein [Joostella sp. CR20]|uniref:VanZ family protein n=1 Tax=Joostella sp. CR20 TaxID=2804312 RepID=UPI00313D133C
MGLNKTTYLLFAALWLLGVTIGSLVSVSVVNEVETNIRVSDKLVHGIFYFGNTILWYCYLRKANFKNVLPKVSLFSFVYGIVIEVLQYILPYDRSFDLKDILANSVGILIAIFLINFWLASRLH